MKRSSLRILVLTKRQYMGKDLLDDRFGRFRELPLALARLGHEVHGISLSYRRRAEGLVTDSVPSQDGQVSWHSFNLLNGFVPALQSYVKHARQSIRDFHPDIIWACSDAYHAIFGYRLSQEYHTRCVIDLYDNFEAFGATKLPPALTLFKRAVKQADGITCFSQRLAERITQIYPRVKPTVVIESGVNTESFSPLDQTLSRQQLGLPQDVRIIGTAGALYRDRGIDVLFRGLEILNAEDGNIHLALAGPRERRSFFPKSPNIHDLGSLSWDRVPLLINALDVAVSCYRDSEIGRYSFPQKAYEIIACRTPIIATAVGTMIDLLSLHPECLFEPDNPESFARAVRSQLASPAPIDLKAPSWSDSARQLEAFFLDLLQAER
jgi:teichuronic acid biosynthesis glycosyltransferase TuaC